MTQPTTSDLLACAEAAALAAGNHARDQSHRRGEVDATFMHDIKLRLDREAQDAAEGVIQHFFPDHAILGEEGSISASPDAPEWIIDPIDGTVNFAHQIPIWCSSVAVRVDGVVQAGVVYVPPLNELYQATIDGPALRNGEPIHPSRVEKLSDALIVTGMSKFLKADTPWFDVIKKLSLQAQKVRVMGAAAVDICHVACGRADAYVETSIHLWDVAAAGLIAERAGASIDIPKTFEDYRMSYLCTNGLLQEELMEQFGSAFVDIA